MELVVDEALLDPQVKEGDESGGGGRRVGHSFKKKTIFLKFLLYEGINRTKDTKYCKNLYFSGENFRPLYS